MKKLLALVLLGIVSVTAVFAEMNIALSVGAPYSNLIVDSVGMNFHGQSYGGTVLWVKPNDLSFKWRVAYEQNQLFSDADSSLGCELTFGIGKAFVHNEKITCTVMPVVGLHFASSDKKPDGWDDYPYVPGETRYDAELITFRAGFDITSVFHLTKAVGIFTNLGLYFDVGSFYNSAETATTENQHEELYNISNTAVGFSFSPSAGISITF